MNYGKLMHDNPLDSILCNSTDKKIVIFSDVINDLINYKGITQSKLAELSNNLESKISRMCRNCNYKGADYRPEPDTVMSICVGFGLDKNEASKMFYIAYPQLLFFEKILNEHMDINQANILLYDNGCKLLGTEKGKE